MQGYDKYGVWALDAAPTTNLRKALGLKVRLGHAFWMGLGPRFGALSAEYWANGCKAVVKKIAAS